MQLIEIVKAVSRRLALPEPSAALGAADPEVLQLVGLLEELGQQVVQHYAPENLRRVATWNAPGTSDQGALQSRFGPDFKGIVPGTFWDQTRKREILGAVSDQQWAALSTVGLSASGEPYWRIFDGRLHVLPAPPAGSSLRATWDSSYWILRSDGTTRAATFANDADTVLLDPTLLLVGLKAFWLREKGQPYSDLLMEFAAMARSVFGRSGGRRIVDLAESVPSRRRGIIVL